MFFSCYAQAGFGIDRLQSHQSHQPRHTLVIDTQAQTMQCSRYFANAIERRLRICLVDQSHYLSVITTCPELMVVKTRPGKTNQGALTVNCDLVMLLLNQSMLFISRTYEIFFKLVKLNFQLTDLLVQLRFKFF